MRPVSPISMNTHARKRKFSQPTSQLVTDWVCLIFLILTPVVGSWIFGANRLWVMGPLIVLILLAGVLAVYRFFVSPHRRDLFIPAGGWLLLLFFTYLVLILPRAEIPYEALLKTVRFLTYIIAFWVLFNVLRINNRWKGALFLLMLSVSVMSWYALIQHVHGTRNVLFVLRPEQYGMRASGTYICPNHFAHLVQMLIITGVGIVCCKRMTIPLRLVAGYTALVSLPALYLTESRSGWIGLMVGLVTLFVSVSLRKGIKKFMVVILLAPLLVGAGGLAVWKMSPMVQARVEQALRGDIRLVLWQDTATIIKESPVLGSGLSSYRWMYGHFREHMLENADPEFAHNDYLHYWAESGVISLLLMALVVFAIVRYAFIVIIKDSDASNRYLMGGMLGMMAGSLAHAFFDFNFHIFANVHAYIFLIAALLASVSEGGHARVDVRDRRSRWLGVSLMVVLSLVCIWYARSLVSYGYVTAATKKAEGMQWDRAVIDYEKAIAWDAQNWKGHIGYAHLLRTRSFWVRDPELKKQWIATSRAHYERAFSLNPWEADAIYGQSTLYKLSGDQEKALALRRQAVEMIPRSVYYLNELGVQLRDMGMISEALDTFRQAQAVEANSTSERNIRLLQSRLTP